MGAVDHIRFEQLEIGHVGIIALEFAHVFDFLELSENKGAVGIAFTVHQGQDGHTVFPAAFAGKPAGRLGERNHAEEQNYGRNHLESPWHSERGRAGEEAATVGDADMLLVLGFASYSDEIGNGVLEHDQNAPSNGPLLGTYKATSFAGWRQFRDVDRDLRRADTNTESVDDATDNEHADVLGCADNRGPDAPDHSSNHDGPLTT